MTVLAIFWKLPVPHISSPLSDTSHRVYCLSGIVVSAVPIIWAPSECRPMQCLSRSPEHECGGPFVAWPAEWDRASCASVLGHWLFSWSPRTHPFHSSHFTWVSHEVYFHWNAYGFFWSAAPGPVLFNTCDSDLAEEVRSLRLHLQLKNWQKQVAWRSTRLFGRAPRKKKKKGENKNISNPNRKGRSRARGKPGAVQNCKAACHLSTRACPQRWPWRPCGAFRGDALSVADWNRGEGPCRTWSK